VARSELTQRLRVAAVGIPAVVAALWIGRWAMGPILALFCAGAALELYRMAEERGVRPLRVMGAAGGALLVLIATALPSVTLAAPLLWTAVLVLALVLALVAIRERGVDGAPLAATAITLIGAVIPGGSMTYAIFLRHLPVEVDPVNGVWASLAGATLVAYPIAATWMCDSAAYFGGKRWGRRKLIPSVSPGKTVVGAVSGLFGGLLGGFLVALVLNAGPGIALHPALGALGGALIAVVSQLGDLAESLWKREAGVKDSGAFFPGHGGILDRMDSLMFTIPAGYWWLALLLAGGVGP
jgi:phosphatidate cytidylyltransferase